MRTAILIVLLGLLASAADAETRLLRFPDLHGETVDNPPEALLRGENPQLARAIEEALQRLRTQPGTLPPRPADPVTTPASGAR